MIRLYLISKEEVLAHKEEVLSFVDDDRRKKSLSCLNEDDILRRLGVGYLYMKILGKSPSYDAKGRPFYEDGPFISLAHSGSYSLLGVSDAPIGVDIEKLGVFPEKTKRFFPMGLDDEGYYEAWCRYEAFAKCLGLGLSYPLNSSLPLEDVHEWEGKKYSLATYIHDGHLIATAVEGEKQEMMMELVHCS